MHPQIILAQDKREAMKQKVLLNEVSNILADTKPSAI